MTRIFSLIGLFSIVVMLFVLGMLSYRLGRVTKATNYYMGFFISSALVMVGIIARLICQTETDDAAWVLLFNGAPALGVTIGLIVAWHYWSWLLAERS